VAPSHRPIRNIGADTVLNSAETSANTQVRNPVVTFAINVMKTILTDIAMKRTREWKYGSTVLELGLYGSSVQLHAPSALNKDKYPLVRTGYVTGWV
jgi:predicted SpoU family rRNA methylase